MGGEGAVKTIPHKGFVWAALATAYLLCEALAWVGQSVFDRAFFSPPRLSAGRKGVIASPPLRRPGRPGVVPEHKREEAPSAEVIHPYLGFVWDPTVMPHVNRLGFWGPPPYLGEGERGTCTVAVVGGSFAHSMAACQGDFLEERLALLPPFADRKVRIVDLAINGYKQPQQLMVLAYMLSLGARFDMMINLDGFNDVAIPPTELIPKNVCPLYPRGWFTRVQGQGFDQESIAQLGEIALAQRWRRGWARSFEAIPLRWSPLANLVWRVGDAGLESLRQRWTLRFERHERGEKEKLSYLTTGPGTLLAHEGDPYRSLAQAWGACSLQMHRLCLANGILYVHFLQPNQYVPGSKPLSKTERKSAYRADSPLRTTVERGYPWLRQEGELLRAKGVPFVDLTMVFEHHPETLYNDECCHCTPEGYRIVAMRIVEEIARWVAKG